MLELLEITLHYYSLVSSLRSKALILFYIHRWETRLQLLREKALRKLWAFKKNHRLSVSLILFINFRATAGRAQGLLLLALDSGVTCAGALGTICGARYNLGQ